MNIEIKNGNAYKTVIDIIERDIIARNAPFGEYLVSLWTGVLGHTNQILSYYCDAATWVWENDWYKGGEVKLLGYVNIDDIDLNEIKEAVIFR